MGTWGGGPFVGFSFARFVRKNQDRGPRRRKAGRGGHREGWGGGHRWAPRVRGGGNGTRKEVHVKDKDGRGR